MENELLKLISYIESAAPQIWEIALRQVTVNIVQLIIATITAAAGFVFFKQKANLKWKQHKVDNWRMSKDEAIVTDAFAISLLILSIVLIIIVTGMIINPEYYAIKIMLNNIR